MKILIITSQIRTRSGHGRMSLDLVNSLKKKGFEIIVLCNKKKEEIKNVKQIAILPDPLSFKKNYFFPWFYILKSLKYKKELQDCDAVHCVVETYSFFTFILSRIFQKKYFLLMHGTYAVLLFRYKLFGLLQKYAYRNARKIVCVSNYTKNKILKYIELDNLVVIPNGVNFDNFGGDSAPTNFHKENILMCLGAFKRRKGFSLIIKALSSVIKEISSIKCFMGGGAGVNGDDYQKTVSLAENLGLAEKIEFFENVSDEYVGDLYKKAKVFALTPVSTEYEFEGFGLIYLEANAYGLPVVAMYGSGAEDAIKDGYSGFLVKEGDVEDIAQKIIKLFKDEKLYKKMSENALAWAKEHSWDSIINEYIKLYADTISR